ncbi:LapA family protein [Clostridium sp.]|uniref:LapA family protein n=1 Tax=Clostridium sp. TaxID=1506 RepID=UPI003D6D8F1D
MRIGFILSLIFAIIVTLFGIQNASITTINFLSAKFDVSLSLVIFISAIIGAIIVTLLGLQKEFVLSRGNKRLTKKANNFEEEIETIKSENTDLKVENETYKNKIELLEANNKISTDEISTLNVEIKRLNDNPKDEIIL